MAHFAACSSEDAIAKEERGSVEWEGRSFACENAIRPLAWAMGLPGPQHLGWAYLASEILLTVTRRSRGTGVRQDRSTLRMLWIVISLSVIAGIYVAAHFRTAALPYRDICRIVAVILFAAGIAL